VQKRVGKINGGLAILKGAGFKQATEGNFLTIDSPDNDVLLKAIELLTPHAD